MDNYVLAPEEVVLFEEDVAVEGKRGDSHLMLTNQAMVFSTRFREGKAFHKTWQTTIEVFPLTDVKIYNDIPQVHQTSVEVKVQMVNKNLEMEFESAKSAKKFTSQLKECITGKAITERGADKVKGAIGLVNSTLGIDTVGTVKGFVENGIVGSVIGGIKEKKKEKQNLVSGAVEIAQGIIDKPRKQKNQQIEEKQSKTADLSYDEQIDAVKKMKELLDAGILTQEEFDNKKREILGL